MFDRSFNNLLLKFKKCTLMPDLSHLRTLLVTLATLSLIACQSQTVRDESIPPERTKRPEAKILEDPRVIGLLESARYDYDQDRLTTPIDNNAYYKYLRVLSISPNNGKANQGIAEIVAVQIHGRHNVEVFRAG